MSRLFSFHFFLSCVIFFQLSYLLFFFLSLICQYKFLNIFCLSLTLLSLNPFDNFSCLCFYLISKSLSFCFSLCFYLSCVEYLSIYYLCLFIFLFSMSVLASLFFVRLIETAAGIGRESHSLALEAPLCTLNHFEKRQQSI